MPELSVVIVNYRCWDKLSDCLNSLLADNQDGFLEIIVVDNQSNDGRLEAFAGLFPSVQFIENEGNYGFANGCNRGASVATAANLLFLNPDTLADRANLERLLKSKADHPEIGLLSCKQLDGNGKNQRAFGFFDSYWMSFGLIRAIAQAAFPKRYSSPRKEHSELVYCDWISGSVVMVSHRLFEQLNGWDDGFWMYSEDVDLSARTAQLGMRVGYEPTACITHLHGGASRASAQTKALTKAEVIVSKHVYINKHTTAWLPRKAKHLDVAVRRVMPIALVALLTLPAQLVGKPSVASMKLSELWRYYLHWARTGDPRSTRCPPR